MIKELFLATIISTSISVRTPNDEDKPLDYEFSVKAEKNEGKSPHKKGTKKYKAHMAAMHAG